jgi:hypothetical protein
MCYGIVSDVGACVIVGVSGVGVMNLNNGFSSAGFCSLISVVCSIIVYKGFL